MTYRDNMNKSSTIASGDAIHAEDNPERVRPLLRDFGSRVTSLLRDYGLAATIVIVTTTSTVAGVIYEPVQGLPLNPVIQGAAVGFVGLFLSGLGAVITNAFLEGKN